jgi:RNA-binding protein
VDSATPSTLSGAEKRALKARAQRLEPVLKLGHGGSSPAFLASLDAALKQHQLVKVRFTDHKEEKKTLAPEIAAQSGSELIMRVGNVAVFYRAGRAAGEEEA